MEKILISACLLGAPVRYNGSSLPLASSLLDKWRKEGRIVSICPEVASGMPIPRAAAEISGGDGNDVLNGSARVLDKTGQDVTTRFLIGAQAALRKCNQHEIGAALLAEASPSCGRHTIYDGRFAGQKKQGLGVTTALLEQNGIHVFSQFEIPALAEALALDK